jgi:5-methylcytosine-specific restriction endonuclease McrA
MARPTLAAHPKFLRLAVHHKIPLIMFDGDLDAANAHDNLITLCRPCHRDEDNRLRIERSRKETS